MAPKIEVVRSVFLQLNTDAAPRLQQAGTFWMNPTLAFYYGSNANSEIMADTAMRRALVRVLQQRGQGLPDNIWMSLMKMINTGTTVAAAIDTLTLASTHANPR